LTIVLLLVHRIVNANQKRSVTCTAVAAGSELEWNFAFQRYLETNVAAEASKMLYGMSCSTEAWILSRFHFFFLLFF